MLRFVAPAGAPLKISQILRSLDGVLSRDGSAGEGLQTFADRVQARYVFGTSSGRAALSLILKSLHRLRPDRCVVALPAYTCFTVAASIVHSGLKLYPVDIDPETLDFDFSQLEALCPEKLLCIVTSNLFGLVNDVRRIREIAQAKGAFVVDDAAQALGASLDGQLAGMLGDVGFYSLGRGKAVSAVEGGIIVTNVDAIASALEAEAKDLAPAHALHNAWLVFQMFVYTIFIHPRLYWIPNSLAFLKLGVTEFDSGFGISHMAGFSQGLLFGLVETLESITRVRRENARAIAQALAGNPSFAMLRITEGCEPTYLRFPLIATNRDTRDQAVSNLTAVGIGASAFYPASICDIAGIESHTAVEDFHRPKAEWVAERLLTLPTHHFVTQRDIRLIAEVLSREA
jgi:perosamine synthetase